MDCIFCKIAKKQVFPKNIYEDDEVLGFENIKPESPLHILFIPKKHIEWKDNFSKEDLQILSKIILVAKKVAIEKKIFGACKFIFNIGKTGHIPHIHLHLLGGWIKNIPMNNI